MNVALARPICLYIFKIVSEPTHSRSFAFCRTDDWDPTLLFYLLISISFSVLCDTWFLIVWIPQMRYRSQYIFNEDCHICKYCKEFFSLFPPTFLKRYVVYFITSEDSVC